MSSGRSGVMPFTARLTQGSLLTAVAFIGLALATTALTKQEINK